MKGKVRLPSVYGQFLGNLQFYIIVKGVVLKGGLLFGVEASESLVGVEVLAGVSVGIEGGFVIDDGGGVPFGVFV